LIASVSSGYNNDTLLTTDNDATTNTTSIVQQFYNYQSVTVHNAYINSLYSIIELLVLTLNRYWSP